MEQLGFALMIITVSVFISTLLACIGLNRRDKQIVALKEELKNIQAWSGDVATKYNEHIIEYHDGGTSR